MGKYLNLGNDGFRSVRKGLYVDKSGLISFMNGVLGSKDKLICVSRPRRFGKSFAAQMLCAYYDKSCDSRELFLDLEAAGHPDFERYRNKYDVIYLDITWFISTAENIRDTVRYLQEEVVSELKASFTEIGTDDRSLPSALAQASEKSGQKFIVIIDEWDALFREAKEQANLQEEYLRLLCGLFKSSQTDKMIEGAYITGILPVKKYGTQSALTDFREYTMLQPRNLVEYTGFTSQEVQTLCQKYHMDFEEMKNWYDGYSFRGLLSVYSPNSVVEAVKSREFGTYWTQTETYESLKSYINMDFDGLKSAVTWMLGGGHFKANVRRFQNDIAGVKSRDDVMTLLVHLGYLAYDAQKDEVYIPNLEIADEFQNAVEGEGWSAVAKALASSDALLDATIAKNSAKVAKLIDCVHEANASVLAYNNENALSCVITIAYYSARKEYLLVREMPAGKGFADIVFLPKKNSHRPAVLVELKWDQSADGAIRQIKEKRYSDALKEYSGTILLVGINYDKKKKKHTCAIEELPVCSEKGFFSFPK